VAADGKQDGACIYRMRPKAASLTSRALILSPTISSRPDGSRAALMATGPPSHMSPLQLQPPPSPSWTVLIVMGIARRELGEAALDLSERPPLLPHGTSYCARAGGAYPIEGKIVDFSTYQRAAQETSQLRLGGPQSAIAPMLGEASETGSILNVYKKYLRDGIDLTAKRQFLHEELGDLLWYAAAVATACGLDLGEIAEANLRRTRDRYPRQPVAHQGGDLPLFDADYPAHERFPRRLTVAFAERRLPSGRAAAVLTLVSAEPNAFPHGPITLAGGKLGGFRVGAELGDPLTDNTRRVNSYRFHDAIHMGFMAVLGWSPTLRALLRLKRKSNPETDECEDGARAIFAEEGLAAVLSRLATRRTGFLSETSVDGEVIEVAKAAAMDLEVEPLPAWLWRNALCQGFRAMHQLGENAGGYLVADLDMRTLTHEKVLS